MPTLQTTTTTITRPPPWNCNKINKKTIPFLSRPMMSEPVTLLMPMPIAEAYALFVVASFQMLLLVPPQTHHHHHHPQQSYHQQQQQRLHRCIWIVAKTFWHVNRDSGRRMPHRATITFLLTCICSQTRDALPITLAILASGPTCCRGIPTVKFHT